MGNLLLDVDGVLLRDRLLAQHVEHNITKYVRSKLPEAKDHTAIRTLLYNKYGHTARGLTQSFGIDTSDFNRKVYNKSLMTHLAEYMQTQQFQKDAYDIHQLIQNDGWKVTLFSNAPVEWTKPVALSIDSRVNIATNDTFLKPEAGAYSQFSKNEDYIFVDDIIKNLLTPSFLPNWTCVHFAEIPTQRKFMTAGSIWELVMMVNSIREWNT